MHKPITCYSLLLAAWPLFAACTGNGVGSTSVSGGTTSGGQTDPNTLSFEPMSAHASARKVKNLLTGQAVTASEYAQIDADANALTALATAWTSSPAYQVAMQRFFADAFQQNRSGYNEYRAMNEGFRVYSAGSLNLRDMFPKTALAIANAGEPFTSVATTQRYMMTTAAMAYYAHIDLLTDDDDAKRSNAWLQAHPNFAFTFQDTNNIPSSDTVNPNSPNFGMVYYPGYTKAAPTDANCTFSPTLQMAATSTNDNFGTWVGQALSYTTSKGYVCTFKTTGFGLTSKDYSDWRWVTIRKPAAGESTDTFYDLTHLRAASSLVLNIPRVGYFTTLPFLAGWPTNVGNEARVTINQTMIVGLNQAFDGSNGGQAGMLPGLDTDHAGDPACYVCHRNLDPMRQFFRHDYSIEFSPQSDSNQTSIPPTFVFDTAPVQLASIYDLANQISQHKQFSAAWVEKLCVWANSTPCDTTDPEFVRLAQSFEQNNFSWNALVVAFVTSPLATNASVTVTNAQTGGLASIARRNHLCATLNQRLNLTDVCKQSSQIGANTSLPLTSALPMDLTLRGSADMLTTRTPDLAFRSMVENVCLLAAQQAVDSKVLPALNSSDPNTALTFLVDDFMGLAPTEDATPKAVLQAHYTAALASATATPDATLSAENVALKSTFVAACVSPWVSAIGF